MYRYNSYLKPIGLLEEEEGPDCTQSNIHARTAALLEDTQTATQDTCEGTGDTGTGTLRSSVSALRSATTSLACDKVKNFVITVSNMRTVLQR